MTVAYDYAIANKGICAAAGYPYRGRQGRCERCNPIATISTYIDLRGLGDEGLIKGLNVGPVTVAVQSNSRGFMFYRSGVINGQCGRSLDHAITAVGYGRDEALGMDYYLVKNSWGTGWGEDGYVAFIFQVAHVAFVVTSYAILLLTLTDRSFTHTLYLSPLTVTCASSVAATCAVSTTWPPSPSSRAWVIPLLVLLRLLLRATPLPALTKGHEEV